MKQILKKLEIDFIYRTGAKYIGIIRTLGVTFASRLSEFTDKLKFIEKNRFITTADKQYLYLHGGSLVEPLVANRAEGSVRVLGSEGTIIPVGLVLVSETIEYEVIQESAINMNGYSDVLVRCKQSGSSANRLLGDEIDLKLIRGGLNQKASVISIQGGTDDETEDEYRTRVKNFIAKPQAPFNNNNIEAILLNNIKTLKYINIEGGEEHPGVVHIYVTNYSFNLSDDEKNKCNDLIKKIQPPHLRSIDVEVREPLKNIQPVRISGVTPSYTELLEAMKIEIIKLFETDTYEKGISKQDIERRLYSINVEGIIVESFNIDVGVHTNPSNTISILGDLEVVE